MGGNVLRSLSASRSEACFSGAPKLDDAVTAYRVNTFHPGLLDVNSAMLVGGAFIGDVQYNVSALIIGTGLASPVVPCAPAMLPFRLSNV